MLASFAEALLLAARIQEARAASEEAVAIARQLDTELELGRALLTLGGAQAASGSFDAAVTSLRRPAGYRTARRPRHGRACLGWLGDSLMQAGRLEDALEVSLSGREPLQRLGLAGQWQDTSDSPRGRGAVQNSAAGTSPQAGDTGVGTGDPGRLVRILDDRNA